MKIRSMMLSALCWLLSISIAFGDVNFVSVPRVIKKEPKYQDKPQYVLITLGDKLQYRHWLVLDGKTLYFDRNGNGDLTEAGERIEPFADYSDEEQSYFKLGDLAVGGNVHADLSVLVRSVKAVSTRDDAPDAKKLDSIEQVLEIRGEFSVPGYRGRCAFGRVPRSAGPYDHDGYLLWKPTPQSANVVHFGEKWSVQLQGCQKLLSGIDNDLILNVGSRGSGTGTFAKLGYENVIPEDVYPRLTIRFSDINGAGMQEHEVVLKERC